MCYGVGVYVFEAGVLFVSNPTINHIHPRASYILDLNLAGNYESTYSGIITLYVAALYLVASNQCTCIVNLESLICMYIYILD